MGKGRKPKTPELRIYEGNPGRRPVPEVTHPGNLPSAPTTLSREAAAEWKRVVDYLGELGLCGLDRGVLSTYCELWAEVQALRKEIREGGRTCTNDKGNVHQNPLVSQLQTAVGQMRLYMSELGLTPASRVKLGSTGDSGLSKMDEYLGELARKRGRA